uniref:Uncharacterized protein n=1 Tax=Anguilla anguilla TaxID=7936 RepID=A0A0E9X782_ANGAN
MELILMAITVLDQKRKRQMQANGISRKDPLVIPLVQAIKTKQKKKNTKTPPSKLQTICSFYSFPLYYRGHFRRRPVKNT